LTRGILSPQETADFLFFFDEANVNGECPHDNAFNGKHLLLYRRGLDARYGPGTADALEERYRNVHFKGKPRKSGRKPSTNKRSPRSRKSSRV
jgi:hypothetical protein